MTTSALTHILPGSCSDAVPAAPTSQPSMSNSSTAAICESTSDEPEAVHASQWLEDALHSERIAINENLILHHKELMAQYSLRFGHLATGMTPAADARTKQASAAAACTGMSEPLTLSVPSLPVASGNLQDRGVQKMPGQNTQLKVDEEDKEMEKREESVDLAYFGHTLTLFIHIAQPQLIRVREK